MNDFFVKDIKDLKDNISQKPGCYFIYSTTSDLTIINGKDVDDLQKRLDKNKSKTLYIGQTTRHLRDRLKELYETATENKHNHRGGCDLWRIKDWEGKLKVHYIECETGVEAQALEYFFISEFKIKHDNNFPFANKKDGNNLSKVEKFKEETEEFIYK